MPANNNHKNKYAMEDVGMIQSTVDKFMSHCVMCKPLQFYDLKETGGKEDIYLATDKSNLRHCVIDLRSGLITFCKLYGDKDGEDLLKKHLNMCAKIQCDECPATIEEIENYFTKKAKEIDAELKGKNYDTG